jgi:hypothetical protein
MLDILRAGAAVTAIGLLAAPAAAQAATAPAGYTIVRRPLMPAPVTPLDSGAQISWVSTIISTSGLPVTDTFATICAA